MRLYRHFEKNAIMTVHLMKIHNESIYHEGIACLQNNVYM